MTEKEYRSHPAVSRSELFVITKSPEQFKYNKENPTQPTQSLIFGQALHKFVLEPKSFFDEFAVLPQIDRRTKEGKQIYADFILQSGEKIIISAEDYEKINDMSQTLNNHSLAKKLLQGEHEKSYFWIDEMTGEQCKCRVDNKTKIGKMNIIVDLKTATCAETEVFMREAIKYGYDFQSAMYTEGVSKNTGENYAFVFIVIEKEPPYAINILQADELFIKRGYDIFRELIGIYHDCKQTGNWYGYLGKFNIINNLSLPAWLAKEIE